MNIYPSPNAGQVWESCDERQKGRRVTVTGVDHNYVCVSTGERKSRIRRDRMRPGPRGYRIVEGSPDGAGGFFYYGRHHHRPELPAEAEVTVWL